MPPGFHTPGPTFSFGIAAGKSTMGYFLHIFVK